MLQFNGVFCIDIYISFAPGFVETRRTGVKGFLLG